MSIVLTELTLSPGQEPVGNKPFEVVLDIAFDGLLDADRTGTVVFFCISPFSVAPHKATVTIPAGVTATKQTCTLTLTGTLPSSSAIVRVFAECDERHSIFVEVT